MIYLVRHGETTANNSKRYYGATDSPLTDIGIKQTKDAVCALQNKPIDCIYTSEKTRCTYLADLLSERTNIKANIDKRLNEANFGVFENLTYEEVISKYSDIFNEWVNDEEYAMPDGESRAQIRQRVADFIEDNKETLLNSNSVIITHKGIIREIVCYLLEFNKDDIWRFSIDNGAIVKIDNDKDYCYLLMER